MLESLPIRPVPGLDCVRRPLRVFIGVAGVGRPERDRKVRAGDAKAVVVAAMDDHVGPGRHVAARAADRRTDAIVPGVRGYGVLVRRMALQADAVAGQLQLRAVRVVAVAAGHALHEHLALLDRPVIIDLVFHLPVGEIKAAGEGRDDVGVGEPAPRDPILGDGSYCVSCGSNNSSSRKHRVMAGLVPAIHANTVSSL